MASNRASDSGVSLSLTEHTKRCELDSHSRRQVSRTFLTFCTPFNGTRPSRSSVSPSSKGFLEAQVNIAGYVRVDANVYLSVVGEILKDLSQNLVGHVKDGQGPEEGSADCVGRLPKLRIVEVEHVDIFIVTRAELRNRSPGSSLQERDSSGNPGSAAPELH
jgi:hypothetical protein